MPLKNADGGGEDALAGDSAAAPSSPAASSFVGSGGSAATLLNCSAAQRVESSGAERSDDAQRGVVSAIAGGRIGVGGWGSGSGIVDSEAM